MTANSLFHAAVGALFITSGSSKILAQHEFVRILSQYLRARSTLSVTTLAVVISLLELCVGVGLWIGKTSWLASIGAASLLVVFTLAVALAMGRAQRPKACGCMAFGRREPLGWNVCFRNAAVGALLLPTFSRISPLAASVGGMCFFLVGVALTGRVSERALRHRV
jgi:uncharacterized membrane protein YphA (DoxX/SURF4 family)